MTKPQQLTAENAKALADRLMQKTNPGKVPKVAKKVPAVDNIDGQIKAVGAALADALVTATEVPVTVLQPVVGALAAQLVALGVRQTKHVDNDAVHAPSWIVQGMREQSATPTDQMRPADMPPAAARTAKAPSRPTRHHSAVRR